MGSAIHFVLAVTCAISLVCERLSAHWRGGSVLFSLLLEAQHPGSEKQGTHSPAHHAVPVTCPGAVQSAPGSSRLVIQTAARPAPALPRDCCGLGMEDHIVGPGPYRATRLVSESGAEPTPRRCHRRDSGCVQSVGGCRCWWSCAGIAAPHSAPQRAGEARSQSHQGGMNFICCWWLDSRL